MPNGEASEEALRPASDDSDAGRSSDSIGRDNAAVASSADSTLPTAADFKREKLNYRELKRIASAVELDGRSKMRKGRLAASLLDPDVRAASHINDDAFVAAYREVLDARSAPRWPRAALDWLRDGRRKARSESSTALRIITNRTTLWVALLTVVLLKLGAFLLYFTTGHKTDDVKRVFPDAFRLHGRVLVGQSETGVEGV